jgi:hypothetical protein
MSRELGFMDSPVYVVEEWRADGKVLKQTYGGFSACLDVRPPKWATHLAMARAFGEVQLWWLQGDGAAVEELRRYYRCDIPREVDIRLFRVE